MTYRSRKIYLSFFRNDFSTVNLTQYFLLLLLRYSRGQDSRKGSYFLIHHCYLSPCLSSGYTDFLSLDSPSHSSPLRPLHRFLVQCILEHPVFFLKPKNLYTTFWKSNKQTKSFTLQILDTPSVCSSFVFTFIFLVHPVATNTTTEPRSTHVTSKSRRSS